MGRQVPWGGAALSRWVLRPGAMCWDTGDFAQHAPTREGQVQGLELWWW